MSNKISLTIFSQSNLIVKGRWGLSVISQYGVEFPVLIFMCLSLSFLSNSRHTGDIRDSGRWAPAPIKGFSG